MDSLHFRSTRDPRGRGLRMPPGLCGMDGRTFERPRVFVCDKMEMGLAPWRRASIRDRSNQGSWSDLPEEAFRDDEALP